MMLPRSLTFLVLSLLGCFPVNAQPVWVPDIRCTTTGPAAFSLYQELAAGRAVVVAIGNIHSAPAAELLEARCLEKMARDYGRPAPGRPTGVSVLFLNLRPAFDRHPLPAGLQFPVANLPEAVGLPDGGWSALIKDGDITLYAILPDRLAYPLTGRHADGWYDQIKALQMRRLPTETPDVRILGAGAAASMRGTALEVTFQNYSACPLKEVQATLFAGSRKMDETTWTGQLASLQTTTLALPLDAAAAGQEIRVVLRTAGEEDRSNNDWTVTVPRMTVPDIAPGAAAIRLTEGIQKIPFAQKLPGQTDTLLLGTFTMDREHAAVLRFKYAHAPSSSFDRSSVALVYSADGGRTWQPLGVLEGAALATAPQQSFAYLPKAADWQLKKLSLPQAKPGTVLQLAAIATADFTNDAYLADLSITDGSTATALK